MAARNRPRGGAAKEDSGDAHEERNMWNQIVNDLKRLKTIQTRVAEVSKTIVEMEGKMAERQFLFLSGFRSRFLHVCKIALHFCKGVLLLNHCQLIVHMHHLAIGQSIPSHPYLCTHTMFFQPQP